MGVNIPKSNPRGLPPFVARGGLHKVSPPHLETSPRGDVAPGATRATGSAPRAG